MEIGANHGHNRICLCENLRLLRQELSNAVTRRTTAAIPKENKRPERLVCPAKNLAGGRCPKQGLVLVGLQKEVPRANPSPPTRSRWHRVVRGLTMAATRGHRGWGWLRKLPSGKYQASYIGPDSKRHYAAHTFSAKLYAEGRLSQERQSIEL